ncbi:MAG: superoxide dismutase family protein [Pricia sp.]
MKTIKLTAMALLLIGTYSCKEVKKDADAAGDSMENEMENSAEMEEEMQSETMTFNMESKSDSDVQGEVTFTQEDGEVMMTAEFSGLDEGSHAIHLHENADCNSDDGKSAGGHWNPTDEPHGKWGAEEGYHKGDIGNFEADADGNATVEFSTDEWCIGCDDDMKNIVGRSVIVHMGTDDFTSQPSGDAGARVACTGIVQ